MDTAQALKIAEELLAGNVSSYPEEDRLDISLEAGELCAALEKLVAARWGYLATITGLDHLEMGQLEILYHFCAGAAVLTLRVSLPRSPIPTIDSICTIIPYATVYEREIAEMLGVVFRNSPNTDRLLLADDLPGDLYPLRKDTVLSEE